MSQRLETQLLLSFEKDLSDQYVRDMLQTYHLKYMVQTGDPIDIREFYEDCFTNWISPWYCASVDDMPYSLLPPIHENISYY